MQVLALEIVIHAEWIAKQNDDPFIRQIRQDYAAGAYDDNTQEASGAEEDLSQVKWESPSDHGGAEGVMSEIEAFNKAMAESHMTVADDGGEWL